MLSINVVLVVHVPVDFLKFNSHNFSFIISPQNNTFQAVLITNGDETFVVFNYAIHGLQWTKGYHLYWRGSKFAHAQAGFSAGDFVRY
jgi:hypothetical protein